MKIKMLIVDDHPAMIEGYKSILQYNSENLEFDFTSVYNCDEAYSQIVSANPFDIILLDIILPSSERHAMKSGADLALLVRKYHPGTRLLILTSHTEAFVLYSIIKEIQPEGFLVKCDVTPEELIKAITTMCEGDTIQSSTVKQGVKQILNRDRYLDYYNRKIISLLAEGIKTKSMPHYLNLSISAIDKRKSQIKDYFDIEKGTDEDIIREARRCGFI